MIEKTETFPKIFSSQQNAFVVNGTETKKLILSKTANNFHSKENKPE